MQKKISLFVALLFVFNLFAFSVSAADVTITSITYPSGKTSYSVGDTVSIKGNCTTGKDLVLRVYNEKDVLIYTDTILAYNNTTGTFEFTGFNIPATNSTGTLNYKVVVTETQDSNETTNVATQNMTVNGTSSSTGSGGGGGGGTNEPTIPNVPWAPKNGTNTDNIDPTWGNELPAQIDPLNPYEQNKELWNAINKVTTQNAAASAIKKITDATDNETMKTEMARNNVAVAAETMTSNISAKKVSVSKSNSLKLDDSIISAADLSKLDKTMQAIEKSIKDNKITLNREMSKELTLNVSFNKKSTATITISKKLVDKLSNVDILTIKDTDFKISYTIDELKAMLGDKNEFSFEIDKSGLTGTTKKLSVNFDVDKTQTVKISFPALSGDTKYMAIVDENGNPVGGRYNPATGVLEAKINESGIYQLVNNEKNFNDIKDKSEEMRESIKILAAKGIIQGTSETEFSPDDTISRAEIAALLLRVLSQVDPNADGGFTDVKKSDWFYGTAGSAKNYGLIVGFEDNTFRGNAVIEKDQILTIASRVLQKEMKYKMPENSSEWLTFSDASEIADWARSDIALATMANIITRTADNTIQASEDITRGDAALIVMRLFYKIW